MYAALSSVKALLIEEWHYNLNDENLECIHELSLLDLNGLELMLQQSQTSEDGSDLFEIDLANLQ
jgi:hypothetical protein